MTSKLAAATLGLLVIGASAPVAAGAAAERAGVAPARAGARDAAGQEERRTAHRCRPSAARRHRCRRALVRRSIIRRAPLRRLGADNLAGAPLAPPGSPGATPPGTPAPPAPPTGGGGTPPLPDYVSATTSEYQIALSRPLVGSGSVTIELRNKGEDPHNLVVSPEDSLTSLHTFPDVAPDAYTASAVTLAPGRYQLWCSLLDHRERGMVATLRVE